MESDSESLSNDSDSESEQESEPSSHVKRLRQHPRRKNAPKKNVRAKKPAPKKVPKKRINQKAILSGCEKCKVAGVRAVLEKKTVISRSTSYSRPCTNIERSQLNAKPHGSETKSIFDNLADMIETHDIPPTSECCTQNMPDPQSELCCSSSKKLENQQPDDKPHEENSVSYSSSKFKPWSIASKGPICSSECAPCVSDKNNMMQVDLAELPNIDAPTFSSMFLPCCTSTETHTPLEAELLDVAQANFERLGIESECCLNNEEANKLQLDSIEESSFGCDSSFGSVLRWLASTRTSMPLLSEQSELCCLGSQKLENQKPDDKPHEEGSFSCSSTETCTPMETDSSDVPPADCPSCSSQSARCLSNEQSNRLQFDSIKQPSFDCPPSFASFVPCFTSTRTAKQLERAEVPPIAAHNLRSERLEASGYGTLDYKGSEPVSSLEAEPMEVPFAAPGPELLPPLQSEPSQGSDGEPNNWPYMQNLWRYLKAGFSEGETISDDNLANLHLAAVEVERWQEAVLDKIMARYESDDEEDSNQNGNKSNE